MPVARVVRVWPGPGPYAPRPGLSKLTSRIPAESTTSPPKPSRSRLSAPGWFPHAVVHDAQRPGRVPAPHHQFHDALSNTNRLSTSSKQVHPSTPTPGVNPRSLNDLLRFAPSGVATRQTRVPNTHP